jgi:hypothetical protein
MAKTYRVERLVINDSAESEAELDAIGLNDWVLVQATPIISDPDDADNWLCIFIK